MKSIVIVRLKAASSAVLVQQLLPAEVRYAWDGMKQGLLRSIHQLASGPGGLLEFETEEPQQVRDFIEGLPLVQANALEVEYFHLAPYTGFDLLSATS